MFPSYEAQRIEAKSSKGFREETAELLFEQSVLFKH
jgi:hypothetical protein